MNHFKVYKQSVLKSKRISIVPTGDSTKLHHFLKITWSRMLRLIGCTVVHFVWSLSRMSPHVQNLCLHDHISCNISSLFKKLHGLLVIHFPIRCTTKITCMSVFVYYNGGLYGNVNFEKTFLFLKIFKVIIILYPQSFPAFVNKQHWTVKIWSVQWLILEYSYYHAFYNLKYDMFNTRKKQQKPKNKQQIMM